MDAQSRLLALEINQQELLRKYTENNRLVVENRKQIQLVKNFLAEQESDIVKKVLTGNVVYQDTQRDLGKTEADLSAQRAKYATLRVQLGQLDGEIQALDLREKEMQNLKRELTTNEKNFQVYDEKMEEARITDDMNKLKLANISVIQPAQVPVAPIKPKKGLNILLGIVFGALSGIGYALFSERNSQGLVSPEIAEKRLNLQVLATIPYKEKKKTMYANFYKLKKEPFHITPDPEFLFLSPSHKEALGSIIYGIGHKKGFVLISGEVGVGKTTIVRSYLEDIDRSKAENNLYFQFQCVFSGSAENDKQ